MIVQTEQQTEQIGEKIANYLRKGDMVLLYGEPGAGKTALVRGIAKGLGVSAPVQSPTFTIINEYPMQDGKLIHMDLYRLTPQGVWELGIEEYCEENICVVEWPDALHYDQRALIVRLSYHEGGREITLSSQGEDGYRWGEMIHAVVGD